MQDISLKPHEQLSEIALKSVDEVIELMEWDDALEVDLDAFYAKVAQWIQERGAELTRADLFYLKALEGRCTLDKQTHCAEVIQQLYSQIVNRSELPSVIQLRFSQHTQLERVSFTSRCDKMFPGALFPLALKALEKSPRSYFELFFLVNVVNRSPTALLLSMIGIEAWANRDSIDPALEEEILRYLLQIGEVNSSEQPTCVKSAYRELEDSAQIWLWNRSNILQRPTLDLLKVMSYAIRLTPKRMNACYQMLSPLISHLEPHARIDLLKALTSLESLQNMSEREIVYRFIRNRLEECYWIGDSETFETFQSSESSSESMIRPLDQRAEAIFFALRQTCRQEESDKLQMLIEGVCTNCIERSAPLKGSSETDPDCLEERYLDERIRLLELRWGEGVVARHFKTADNRTVCQMNALCDLLECVCQGEFEWVKNWLLTTDSNELHAIIHVVNPHLRLIRQSRLTIPGALFLLGSMPPHCRAPALSEADRGTVFDFRHLIVPHDNEEVWKFLIGGEFIGFFSPRHVERELRNIPWEKRSEFFKAALRSKGVKLKEFVPLVDRIGLLAAQNILLKFPPSEFDTHCVDRGKSIRSVAALPGGEIEKFSALLSKEFDVKSSAQLIELLPLLTGLEGAPPPTISTIEEWLGHLKKSALLIVFVRWEGEQQLEIRSYEQFYLLYRVLLDLERILSENERENVTAFFHTFFSKSKADCGQLNELIEILTTVKKSHDFFGFLQLLRKSAKVIPLSLNCFNRLGQLLIKTPRVLDVSMRYFEIFPRRIRILKKDSSETEDQLLNLIDQLSALSDEVSRFFFKILTFTFNQMDSEGFAESLIQGSQALLNVVKMTKLQNDEIIKNLLLEVNQGQDLIHMFPYLDRFWRSAESIESPKIDESDSFVLKQLISQSPNSVGIKGLIRGIGRIKRCYFQLVFQLPLFNAIKSGHEFYLAVSCVCQIDQFLSDCDAPALDQLMDAVAPLLKYCKTTYQAIEVIYAYAGYRPEFPLSVYKMPSEDLKLRVEKWADRLAPECLGEFIYALGLLPQVPDEEVDQLFYTLIENRSPDFISKCIHLITPLTTQARWEYLKAVDRLKNKLSDWEEFNASLMLLRTFPENVFSKVVQLFEEGIIETRSNRESSQKCDEFRSIFEWIFDEGFSELTEQHIMDFYTFCYSDGIEFEEYFFNLFQKAWAKDPRYFRIFITNLAEFDSDSTKDTAVAGAILEQLQKTDVENWASEEINLLLLNLKNVGKGFHPETILSLVNRSPRVCQVFVSLLDSPPEAMADYCRDLKVAELYPSIERHIGEFEVNAVYDLYISVQNGFLKCLPDREVKILELSKKHPLFMENALSLPENLEKIKSFLLDDEGKGFLEGFRRMIWSKCCALRKLVEELYPLKTDANLKYYAPHAFVNSRQCLSIYSPREIASQRPEEILEEVYPLISGTKREDLPTSLWVKWTLDSGIDQSGVSKELVTSIAEGVVKKMKMGKQKIPLPISLDQEKKSEDETELSDLYLQFGVFLRFLLHLGGKFPTGSLFELEVYDVLLNKVQSSMAYEEMINAYLMLYGDDRLEMQGIREAVGGYGECVLEFLNWEGKTPSKRIAVLLDSYYEESEEQPPYGLYSKYFGDVSFYTVRESDLQEKIADWYLETRMVKEKLWSINLLAKALDFSDEPGWWSYFRSKGAAHLREMIEGKFDRQMLINCCLTFCDVPLAIRRTYLKWLRETPKDLYLMRFLKDVTSSIALKEETKIKMFYKLCSEMGITHVSCTNSIIILKAKNRTELLERIGEIQALFHAYETNSIGIFNSIA